VLSKVIRGLSRNFSTATKATTTAPASDDKSKKTASVGHISQVIGAVVDV
jgi:hypothetical protein